jgi:GPH family glycoside/pentoside/hexuronide:cation symporter
MYNLGLSENQVGTLYIFLWVAAVPFIPVLDFICVKFSKKAAWLIGLGAWAADMLIFPWLVMHPDKIFFAYLFMGIASIGFMAVYQVAWSIIPDAVEVDEYKTGQRREGLYYGAVTFIQKCAAAAAFAIAGLVLTNIGYDPEIESQSAVTLTGLKGMLSFGTAGFLILSCITAVFHPMTRTRHAALLKGIEDKKLNKKVDESLFKAVL